jgi:hypothetical protein
MRIGFVRVLRFAYQLTNETFYEPRLGGNCDQPGIRYRLTPVKRHETRQTPHLLRAACLAVIPYAPKGRKIFIGKYEVLVQACAGLEYPTPSDLVELYINGASRDAELGCNLFWLKVLQHSKG